MPLKLNPITGKLDLVNASTAASNSFSTIAVPSGTSPVATSSSDTLHLAVATGGNLTITGNSTTDTVSFALASPIKDLSAIASIDWDNRTTRDTSGFTSIHYGVRGLYDSSAQLSIDWQNKALFFSIGVVSLDYSIGQVYDTGGTQSISWNSRLLFSITADVTLDWGAGVLTSAFDLNESLDWTNRITYDSVTGQSMDWGNRTLSDASTVAAIDWANRYAFDSSFQQSIDWQNRRLYDAAGIQSGDWTTRTLYDGSNIISVGWTVRTLNDSSGATSLSWNTTGIVISKVLTACNGINGQGGGLPVLVGVVSKTNQTASLGTTNIIASVQLTGLYHIDAILLVTTVGSAGSLSGSINYTDPNNTAQTITLASILLTGNNIDTVNQPVYLKGGTALTYTTTVTGAVGTPKYNLVIGVKALF